jgi:hypothetical protein
MKRILFIFFCISIFYTLVFAQQKPNKKLPEILPETAFKDGEELNYILHYGFINGGAATIKVENAKINDINVLHASAIAKTTGIADKLFRVVDIYESYFTIDKNLPVKAIRNIKEGNYKYYDEVTFNRTDNTVLSQKTGIHKVPENVLDMVSAFFYIRRVDFAKVKVGDTLYVDTFFGDDLFPFYIIFQGRETISTDAGKFRCLKFLPIVEPGRIFKENDDMLFWFSDDQNKIPVRVKFDMIVGSFKCDLVSYKNLKYPAFSLYKK